MKNKLTQYSLTILFSLFIIFTLSFIKDIIHFNSFIGEKEEVIGYESNILKHPYIYLRVYLTDKENILVYWTFNYIKTETWLVKYTKINNTFFWTVLERQDLSHIKEN